MKIVVRNKGSKPWLPEVHDEQLRELHAAGMPDLEIAAEMGFAEGTIANKRMLLRLPANARQQRPRGGSWDVGGRMPKDKPNPFAIAASTWGRAFDHERMRLHGQPIRFLDLMRATNERRKARGLEQWTGDEACVIP